MIQLAQFIKFTVFTFTLLICNPNQIIHFINSLPFKEIGNHTIRSLAFFSLIQPYFLAIQFGFINSLIKY